MAQEMAIPGPQMNGTQYPPNITVFPDRDPNDNRGIRIPRRAFKMSDTETVKGPDINNPKDGNKVVSPDNLHTDPVQEVVDPEAAIKQTKVEPKDTPKETLAPTPTPAVTPEPTPAPAPVPDPVVPEAPVASVVFPVKAEDKPSE